MMETKTRKEKIFNALMEKVKKERKEYKEDTNLDELDNEGKMAYEASLLVFDEFILKVTVPENMELTNERFVTLKVSEKKVNELFNKMYEKIDKGAVQNFVHKMHRLYLNEFNGRSDTIDVGTGDKYESIMYKFVIE